MKVKRILSIQGIPKRYLAVLSNNYIMTVPKLMVFDLDGCLWDPEMYELIGCGGSPFTLKYGFCKKSLRKNKTLAS